jgi:DNA-directed RNA polymerase specialized sigma24 family protein
MPRTAGQMPAEGPDGGRPHSGFHEELLRICTGPEAWGLALRRAGSRDLAEDALQETFYAVSRVKDPGHIENLRAFFCKSLIREINHQRAQLRPIPVEDPETVAGNQQRLPLPGRAAGTVDGEAVWLVLAETWLTRFHREREQLRVMVPERSNDPGRYRHVVVAVAEEILRTAVQDRVSWADCNKALQAAHPSWLNEPGCDLATLYQRLRRARQDIRMLLKTVVTRDEL